MQQYYTDNNLMILNAEFHASVSDISNWSHDRPPNNPIELNQLAKEFPEAKKRIKELIKEYKEILKGKVKAETEIKTFIYRQNLPYSKREEAENLISLFILKVHYNYYEQQIKRLEKILLYYEPKKVKEGSITDRDVEQARGRPISDFIDFSRDGTAKSIWNEGDKTPSMHYYKKENRVHCFSTGKNEDVIGVVMQKYNLDFIKAVKYILTK